MKLSEKQLQPKLHKYISNPSLVFATLSGKRLQILSPGKLNVKEGLRFIRYCNPIGWDGLCG